MQCNDDGNNRRKKIKSLMTEQGKSSWTINGKQNEILCYRHVAKLINDLVDFVPFDDIFFSYISVRCGRK